jgi:hypothetical protein
VAFNVLQFIYKKIITISFQLKSKRFANGLVELRHLSIQKVVLGQQCAYQWDPENWDLLPSNFYKNSTSNQ